MAVARSVPKKYKIEDRTTSLRVVFKRPGSMISAIFILVWLVFWTGGVLVAIGFLIGEVGSRFAGGFTDLGPDTIIAGAFVLFWLTGWTLGGFSAVRSLRRTAAGKEIVDIDNSTLRIKNSLLGLGGSREYDTDYVDNLRAVPETDTPRFRVAGDPYGPLAFDYVNRTQYFGGAISADEAKEVVAAIGERYPDLVRGVGEPERAAK